jgi:hypothetical protein
VTSENPRPRNWTAIWSGISAITTLGILIATSIYATFAYQQWQAMIDSNRINNLGLVEIQRASILYDGMSLSSFTNGYTVLGDPKVSVVGPGIGISPIWSNAGGTATKDLRIFFGDPIESVTPIERPDMRIPKDTKWVPIVVGPKGRQNGVIRPIAMEKIKAIRDGKLHIYLWGDAYYNDIFPSTREHVTKFCQEIGGVNFGFNQLKEEVLVSVVLAPCTIHNCIDDQCKEQEKERP